MYVRPSGPLSIGGVLDDGLRLYRSAFAHCWGLALAFAVVLGAVQILLLLSLPLPGNAAKLTPQQTLALMRSPALIGGYLLLIVASLVFQGAMLARINAVAQGDASYTAARAVATSLRRLPGILLAAFVVLLVVVVALVALIVPGIYVGGRLQLWLVAMFADDAAPLESLSISWRLLKGRWWRAATILTVALIMIYVIVALVGVIAGVVGVASRRNMLEGQIFVQVISAASNVVVGPALPAIWLAMYRDFKLRSEGGDLAARVGALGNA